MKTYKGFWRDGECLVTVNDKVLDQQSKVRNHSPTGFQWGYAGSGPAQLALAICINAVGRERGERVYQQFKFDVVANLTEGGDWELTEDQVVRVIEYIEKERLSAA